MDLTAQREIGRAADDVFDFFADAANNPKWQSGMKSCVWVTDGPITIGSRYRQVAGFMGRKIISVFEVTGFEPGRSIRIATVESTFPIAVTRTVAPIDQHRCTVAAEISGGPRVPRLLRPMMRWVAQRSVDRDYDRLVALLS